MTPDGKVSIHRAAEMDWKCIGTLLVKVILCRHDKAAVRSGAGTDQLGLFDSLLLFVNHQGISAYISAHKK